MNSIFAIENSIWSSGAGNIVMIYIENSIDEPMLFTFWHYLYNVVGDTVKTTLIYISLQFVCKFLSAFLHWHREIYVNETLKHTNWIYTAFLHCSLNCLMNRNYFFETLFTIDNFNLWIFYSHKMLSRKFSEKIFGKKNQKEF